MDRDGLVRIGANPISRCKSGFRIGMVFVDGALI
jgi:hypothetical protein